jgi:hypothetical protein
MLQSPPLVHGHYLVDLWFGDGEVNLDCIEKAMQFEIEGSDIFGSGRTPLAHVGSMYLIAKWNIL